MAPQKLTPKPAEKTINKPDRKSVQVDENKTIAVLKVVKRSKSCDAEEAYVDTKDIDALSSQFSAALQLSQRTVTKKD